jgi:F0F1-type ATP synthase assembly protein I
MFEAMIPSTVDRVPLNTADVYNERIRQDAERRVAQCARLGRAAIDKRLAELDQEWDVERTLEANAATAVLVGSTLGFLVDRRFFLFPIVVGGFLLQHAVQGWCPPLPVFRSMGVRTQPEIEEERYALKALRGDFASTAGGDQPGSRSPKAALEAARR